MYVPNRIARALALLLAGAFCLAGFVAPAISAAQVAGTGNIQGLVSDPAGAVIPGAKVSLTNEATQVTRTVQSDHAGVYIFPNIEIGSYTVSVTSPGFEAFKSAHNVLEVGSNIAINVKMTIGAETQTVSVEATGLALQTEDASFKQTVDQQDITELPLNSASRQITGLLAISGGETTAPAGDFTGSKYSYQTISVSIAGGGGNTTMWRLDGGDNNDYMANGNLPFPFPDAVAQFSLESTALGAQDGMHSGGLVNVVTRSGTNKLHVVGFEFIRNNYLDATNFFSTSKDTLHQNQYGFTVGGPVWIPKVYNGKDKFFFFVGYQHLKNDQSQASTQAHVPTAANLAGDFSTTDPLTGITSSSCASKALQLYDPVTGAKLTGNKYATPPVYSAQALKLLTYLPAINPAVDTNNCGLVSYSIPSQVYDNEVITREDYTINSKHHLYGHYFLDGYQAPAFYSPTNILITTQSGNYERTQSVTIGEDWTINSNTVNSAHVTLLRRRNNRGFAPNDINATTLGVNDYQAVPNGLYLAVASKFTIGGGTNSVSHFNDNSLAFDDEVTMVRGKHQFVFGGEFVRNQLNISNAYESNGVFEFGGLASGSPGSGTGTTVGDANLDLLFGYMTPSGSTPAFQQSKFQANALRGNIPSVYAQDTFHATKRLTLVAGIRWSPEYMPVDVFHRGTTFNMANFLSNTVSSVYPTAPAGTLFFGDPGVPAAFTLSSPLQFSPNFGFAVDPQGDGKTVFRGGAEMIYDEVNFFTGQRTQQNPPFATAISQVQTSTSGPVLLAAPWSQGTITTDPFPQPAVPTQANAQFFPQSQYIVLPPQYHPSYSIQYTLSLQHQFGAGYQFQIDYIGNQSRHVPFGHPIDPAIFVPGVWGAGGTGCAGVVTTGPAGKPAGAAGTPCSTTGDQTQRFLLTELNPLQGNQYSGGGGGSVFIGDSGTANYNGMVATIQHRLSSSFSLLANYTWSKCLNEEDAQGDLAGTTVENPNNPRGDYGPCGSDYRHVANIVLVTRSQFHMANAVARAFVNGWEFSPLAHLTSGAPFTVTAGADYSLTDIGNDRPNYIGGPIYLHQQLSSAAASVSTRGYLNPAAFAQVTAPCVAALGSVTPTAANCPAFGTYGNIGRDSFRGLPQYQFDAQISRIFPIYERLSTTLRLEAFNVLNHPNFATPNAGLSSSSFGQISATNNAARVFQGSIKVEF
jgi:hypothetical protein